MSELPAGFVFMDQAQGDIPEGFSLVPPQKKKFTLADTWPARLAKGVAETAYRGATLPGDVWSGKTPIVGGDGRTNPEVIERSADLASMAAPVGPRAAATLKPVAGPPSREAIEQAAKSAYDDVRNLGLEVHPASLAQFAGVAAAELSKKGFNADVAPTVHKILEGLSSPPRGSVVTADNLDALRRNLANLGKNYNNKTEQAAALRAVRLLDDYLPSLPESHVLAGDAAKAAKLFGDARGNYAAARRSETVAKAVTRADRNAAAANSGANTGNAIRQQFRGILNSDRKSAGFNADELARMERIDRGTAFGNTTRAVGNMLGGGGGLGAVVAAGVGGAATAPYGGFGAALPAVGWLLKRASDASTRRQATILDEMVRGRSPLAQGMPAVKSELPPQVLARILLGLPVASGRAFATD